MKLQHFENLSDYDQRLPAKSGQVLSFTCLLDWERQISTLPNSVLTNKRRLTLVLID